MKWKREQRQEAFLEGYGDAWAAFRLRKFTVGYIIETIDMGRSLLSGTHERGTHRDWIAYCQGAYLATTDINHAQTVGLIKSAPFPKAVSFTEPPFCF